MQQIYPIFIRVTRKIKFILLFISDITMDPNKLFKGLTWADLIMV